MVLAGIFLVVGGFISLFLSYKHMLNILLSLEFLLLGLIILYFLWFGSRQGEGLFILYYIVFVVAEGVLGLSLLVGLVR